MKPALFSSLLLLMLAACAPSPLVSSQMMPDKVIYGQIEKNAYLKGKIMVGEVDYAGEKKGMAPLYISASDSLALTLQQAGYLAADEASAKYRLNATIKDVEFPSCLFGSCETGSAVKYTLNDIKRDRTVYQELLVVPYTGEYPLFGANMTLVQRRMLGSALGENYAHLLQVLSRKIKSDFK